MCALWISDVGWDVDRMVDILCQDASTCKSIQQISLPCGAFCFLREKHKSFDPLHFPSFCSWPTTEKPTHVLFSPQACTSASSLSPQIMHNIALRPTTTPMTIFPTTSFTHPRHSWSVSARGRAEGCRRVAHHGIPLQKACKCFCSGEIMRGDAQAGGEKYPMRDRCRHGERGQGRIEESWSRPGLAGQR